MSIVASDGLFLISTDQTSYAMEVNTDGRLANIHWGARIDRLADLPRGEGLHGYPDMYGEKRELFRLEYPEWGGYRFEEPCLKVRLPNGSRGLDLRFVDHQISTVPGGSALDLTLQDTVHPVRIVLHYRVFDGLDVIDRSATIVNGGTEALVLDTVYSAAWHLPRGERYRLTHHTGKKFGEYQLERELLTHSKRVIESRRGHSGHDSTPWLAVDLNGAACETAGEVWFAALHWSGNFKIVVETSRVGQTTVVGGISDFDLSWKLGVGERFTTPVFTGGYTASGFGAASRILHRYEAQQVLPRRRAGRPRPVIWNSWELEFDVDERRLLDMAEQCARIGVEMFVLDDGWFSTRDDDGPTSGLGDWWVSPTKFPRDLAPVVDRVKSLGMQFGIWVEPEMVNPGSRLAQEHPEWIVRFPDRAGSLFRDQLVLNFARDDVRDWAIEWLDALISTYNVDLLKWDMNRYLSEPGWPDMPPDEQQGIWIRYTRNLYQVFEALGQRHPDVWLENCASGGGRTDLGMMALTDHSNPSDNHDPLDVIRMFEGYSHAYPARYYNAVIDISDRVRGINARCVNPRFNAHVGLLGVCYVHATGLSAAQGEQMRRYIELYKAVRDLVQFGELHRLASIYEHPFLALSFVAPDRSSALLLVYGAQQQFRNQIPNIRLRGLDPQRIYAVEEFRDLSGRALMEIGLPIDLVGDYDSRAIRIRAL